MENFGEIKIKPTYCAKRSKHRDGKVWNFLLFSLYFSWEKFIAILSTSSKFLVGQSKKFN